MATPLKSALLPYQIRWVQDDAPVKVAEKGRRIGLTWAEAADAVIYSSAADGGDTYYIGYNRELALEFVETVADWARKFDAVASQIEDAGEVLEDADREKGILAYKVRFASGNKIVALSSRPANLRGKQGRVVIDEAAFHEDLGEVLKAAFALIIWGGSVRIISTHNGEANPFNELVGDIRAGRVPYSLHRITFDDALSDGLYRRICRVRRMVWTAAGEREFRERIYAIYRGNADEELDCIPSSGSGVYFSGALLEAHMLAGIPVLRWERPASFAERPKHMREAEAHDWCEAFLQPVLEELQPNWLSCFGEDFGRSGDLTVIWPMQIRPDLVRHTPFLVELRNIPFEQQRQVLFYVADRLPRFYAGKLDARGNGQYLAEVAMQRYGSGRIEQVMLTPGWYGEHFPPYKAAVEDGEVTLPKDADVLADHRLVRMERGLPRIPDNARTQGADGKQRHGDSAVAAVLAYAASRVDPVEFDYTPARGRGRFDEPHPDDDPGEAPRRFALRGGW